ncbi:hypothetical protein HaLaN_16678 [Haematococcus lacustris]|uniref:Uncharacterized protein n=1 Tax=Haematococcus lacustris TaxID=44745 RepID=A0A699ZEK5_HAELA|nr:hypothetical protein HaLaN_16678 [Haematococcus lacustris]
MAGRHDHRPHLRPHPWIVEVRHQHGDTTAGAGCALRAGSVEADSIGPAWQRIQLASLPLASSE